MVFASSSILLGPVQATRLCLFSLPPPCISHPFSFPDVWVFRRHRNSSSEVIDGVCRTQELVKTTCGLSFPLVKGVPRLVGGVVLRHVEFLQLPPPLFRLSISTGE